MKLLTTLCLLCLLCLCGFANAAPKPPSSKPCAAASTNFNAKPRPSAWRAFAMRHRAAMERRRAHLLRREPDQV